MKKVILTAFAALIAVSLVSTNVMAKGGAKAGKDTASTITGTLAVVKDADGKATGATITTTSGTVYTLAALTGDEAALDGKEVSAKGEVKDEAGKMTLTVKGKVAAVVEKKEKVEKKKKK